ncbi:MAG: hypothetical protein IPF57_13680 [Gammaproteobacteria bacterium]|nr:hypothetical protein [Gammaproteobacteria bacterium]MBK9467500.1 hypothetical protein [Gammaproteobacteria bacterium]
MLAALVAAFALWWGPRVALAADTWSASSGSYTSSHASGPREYTYQNVGGVQSYQYDTPGGHATVTYRPAGTPGVGNHVYDNTGTGATARSGVNVPYAPGKTGKAEIHTPLPKAGIAAAAAILAKAVGPVSLALTASAIYDALTDDGYGEDANNPGHWGKTESPLPPNPTIATQTFAAYYTSANQAQSAICAGSTSACTYNTTYTGPPGATTSMGYLTGNHYVNVSTGGGWTYSGTGSFSGWTGPMPRKAYFQSSCPAGFTWSSSTPAGCWSNGGSRPLTPTEEAAMESAIIDGCPGGCGFGPMVPPILNSGGTIPGPFGPSWITIPDSGPGGGYTSDSQTTTRPDGTQQVTENSYSPSASGDTVQVQRTTTVTEKDALGNVTSVTTTVGNATPEAPPAANPPSLCEEFPEVLACIDVGEAPAAESMPTDSVDVDAITPVAVSGVETCPAPVAINLGSHGSYALSWQPACDVATGVRPVLIGLAWLAAAMIVFGVRGGVPD